LGAAALVGDAGSAGYAATAAARLAHSRADPDGVLAATAPLAAFAVRGALDEPGVFEWRPLHVEALIRTGRLMEAELALEPLERISHQRRRASAIALAARSRGILEAARGNPGAANAAFIRSLDDLRALGMPFELAYTQLCFGEALIEFADRIALESALRAATEAFTSLGARPFLDRAALARSRAGMAPQSPHPLHSSVDLTAQELAVARLVAGGLSNAEAASHLVVSVKTVEFHLTNIYRKVGVGSRGKLIMWWQARSSLSR
jgi:DNA-binding CsgD family transcriptional regulator